MNGKLCLWKSGHEANSRLAGLHPELAVGPGIIIAIIIIIKDRICRNFYESVQKPEKCCFDTNFIVTTSQPYADEYTACT